jgi:hypothetical protein
MDADAVLRPKNLLHFLRFLHRQIDPGSPVYFGSAFGTYNCTDDPSDNCRSFTFNKGEPSRTDRWGKAKKRGKRLRESPEWLALEKELLILNLGEERWRAQQLVENRTAIMYALGGVYGLSRPGAFDPLQVPEEARGHSMPWMRAQHAHSRGCESGAVHASQPGNYL